MKFKIVCNRNKINYSIAEALFVASQIVNGQYEAAESGAYNRKSQEWFATETFDRQQAKYNGNNVDEGNNEFAHFRIRIFH